MIYLAGRTSKQCTTVPEPSGHFRLMPHSQLEITPFDGLRMHLANTPLAVLADKVIIVQHYALEGGLRRLLVVLRMRLSMFDRTLL